MDNYSVRLLVHLLQTSQTRARSSTITKSKKRERIAENYSDRYTSFTEIQFSKGLDCGLNICGRMVEYWGFSGLV